MTMNTNDMALYLPEVPEGYERLVDVLNRALNQAAFGKGAERHADMLPFHEQPMQSISDTVGLGFTLGQALKKWQESGRMNPDPAVRELLGAINYIAGAVIYIERQAESAEHAAFDLSSSL